MAYCADSDPISEATPAVLSVPDTALDAGSASACMVANDSLQVLLQQGKRQSEVMQAAGSAAAVAERGALVLCRTDLAGRGVQVEEDLDDLDDTQVTEPGRKRWKEDNVAKEMLMRCAEEAAGRATSEVKPSDAGCSGPGSTHCRERSAHDGTTDRLSERSL